VSLPGGSYRDGSDGLSDKVEGALLPEQEETPFGEIEELQTLLADGRERGYLTVEEVAGCLAEVDVTK
jgi:hypothetical protein